MYQFERINIMLKDYHLFHFIEIVVIDYKW
jgi:hypothetical protein